jgi:DNA polymerase III epsilon subunit-like protein
MEFASVTVTNGEVTDTYEALFAAGEVPPVIQALTHISQDALKDKPRIDDRKTEVLSHIPEGAIMVGQNLAFDLSMLKGHGMDLTERPWIDTSLLASLVFPELASYSLGYMSRVLNLDHSPQHRALGDVRATLGMLSKIWERLLELPPDLLEDAKTYMARGPKGYQDFFAALPKAKSTTRPVWMESRARSNRDDTMAPLAPPDADVGHVTLLEESLAPDFVSRLIEGARKEKTKHWFAVKNVDAFLRRSGLSLTSKDVRVLWNPWQVLDPTAAKELQKAETLSAEEATLAVKMAWLRPKVRSDMPVHGGEEPVWSGKLACTKKNAAYLEQFQDLPTVAVLDHRELLSIVTDESHPGHAILAGGKVHVTIDDASMLEDTATKAFGWECNTEALRAASTGNAGLTQITDVLQLWLEKTRSSQDVRYLTISDLKGQEAMGLRAQLQSILKETLPEQTRSMLEHAEKILNPENLDHRIAWIEMWQNGTLVFSSVPEQVGVLLKDELFDTAPTTLLVPQGCSAILPEILPPGGGAGSKIVHTSEHFAIPMTIETTLTPEKILEAPPEGKTVILVPSKSMAESLYVRFLARMEEQGITLICQGLSGGQGRMQAEFLAAEGRAIWVLTPFSFEGMDLPLGTVDQCFLKAVPFDHPSQTILSRRALRYGNAFEDYLLPRLQHRLFRLLRTFCRMRSATAGMFVMDERLEQKAYGPRIMKYLHDITAEGNQQSPSDNHQSASGGLAKPSKKLADAGFVKKPLAGAKPKAKTATKPKKPKPESPQLPLL